LVDGEREAPHNNSRRQLINDLRSAADQLEEAEDDREQHRRVEREERAERKKSFRRLIDGGAVTIVGAGVLATVRKPIGAALAGVLAGAAVGAGTATLYQHQPQHRPPHMVLPGRPTPPPAAIPSPRPRSPKPDRQRDPPPSRDEVPALAPADAEPIIGPPIIDEPDLPTPPAVDTPPAKHQNAPRVRDPNCAIGMDVPLLSGRLGDKLASGLMCRRG
jgi:hypothetical protein